MKLDAHAMSVSVAEDWLRSFWKPLDWQSNTYLRACLFSRAVSSHGRWVKSDLNGFQRKCERKKRRSELQLTLFQCPSEYLLVSSLLLRCGVTWVSRYIADWALQFGCCAMSFNLLQLRLLSLVTPEDHFGVLLQRKTKNLLQIASANSSSLLLFQFHACLSVSILISSNILLYFSAARGGSKAQPICSDIKRCLDVRDMWAREKETEVKRRRRAGLTCRLTCFRGPPFPCRSAWMPASNLESRSSLGLPNSLPCYSDHSQATQQTAFSLSFCHPASLHPSISLQPNLLQKWLNKN